MGKKPLFAKKSQYLYETSVYKMAQTPICSGG